MIKLTLIKTLATTRVAISLSGFDNNLSKVFPFFFLLLSKLVLEEEEIERKATSAPDTEISARSNRNATAINIGMAKGDWRINSELELTNECASVSKIKIIG